MSAVDRRQLKAIAIQLRLEDRLSYNEITGKIGVAKSTLHEWLKDFPLSPEEKYAKWQSKVGNRNKRLKLIYPPVVQRERTSDCESEGREFESLQVDHHDTNRTGDISVSMLIARLLRVGYEVFLPFGSHQRYDLLIEKNGIYSRVQVKSGRIKKGTVEFNGYSISYKVSLDKRGSRRYTKEEIDYFAIYCAANDKAYLVPIEDVTGKVGTLRIEPMPHTNGIRRIRWAVMYEI
jgi:hypothetical protein